MWRFFLHDTITGAKLEEVWPSAGSWTRRLNGQGSGSHTFQLGDTLTGLGRTLWRDFLTPNSRTLVVAWGQTPVYAGIISQTRYSRDAGAVVVQHQELRSLFKARLTFGVNVYPQGDLTITNRSAAGAVRAILARAVQWSSEWNLPLTLPADGAGSISKAWKRHQILTIEDCLQEIEAEGWEIDFLPTYDSAMKLTWVARVGNPISGDLTDYHLGADGSPLTDVTVTIDGTDQLTGVFVSGNGTGPDIVTAWAGSTAGQVIPIRDASRPGGSERETAALQRIAQAYLDDWSTPVVQWSFAVNLESVSPLVFRPSERVKLITKDDLWVADGDRTVRVVALSGDMSLSVRPEVN